MRTASMMSSDEIARETVKQLHEDNARLQNALEVERGWVRALSKDNGLLIEAADKTRAGRKCIDLHGRNEKLTEDNAALREQIGLKLAACDCAAMLDTAETHEGNKTVTRDNPSWSPAFESVMRRTAECIKLRSENATLRADKERLDWLENHRNAGVGATATKRIAGLSRTLEDFRDYEWKGDTVRAAIDAARAAPEGKP